MSSLSSMTHLSCFDKKEAIPVHEYEEDEMQSSCENVCPVVKQRENEVDMMYFIR